MRQCQNPRCAIVKYPNDDSVKLRYCSACGVANYCSAECQKADWRRHKQVCENLKTSREEKNKSCGLCGNRMPPFTLTTCCNRVVCDDQSDYQLMSYARNSCSRNHWRYSLCSFHHTEGHGSSDWKTCQECKSSFEEYEWFKMGSNPPEAPACVNFPDDVLTSETRPALPRCSQCQKEINFYANEAFSVGYCSHGQSGMRCSRCSGMGDARPGVVHSHPAMVFPNM